MTFHSIVSYQSRLGHPELGLSTSPSQSEDGQMGIKEGSNERMKGERFKLKYD